MRRSVWAASTTLERAGKLAAAKLLCKAGRSPLASGLVAEAEGAVGECAGCTPRRRLPLALARWAVNIHAAEDLAEERGKAFTECARGLRSLSAPPPEPQQTQAVLEGCGLVLWAVEAGHCSKLPAPVLLAWFSFLEEHQELLTKALQKVGFPSMSPG